LAVTVYHITLNTNITKARRLSHNGIYNTPHQIILKVRTHNHLGQF